MQANVAIAGPKPKMMASCEAPNAESVERSAVPQTRIARVIGDASLIRFTAKR